MIFDMIFYVKKISIKQEKRKIKNKKDTFLKKCVKKEVLHERASSTHQKNSLKTNRKKVFEMNEEKVYNKQKGGRMFEKE